MTDPKRRSPAALRAHQRQRQAGGPHDEGRTRGEEERMAIEESERQGDCDCAHVDLGDGVVSVYVCPEHGGQPVMTWSAPCDCPARALAKDWLDLADEWDAAPTRSPARQVAQHTATMRACARELLAALDSGGDNND